MGFFRRLFKKSPNLRIEDPVFGRMEYERGTWSTIPDWDRGGFAVGVEAPESGPSELQRSFFTGLTAEIGAIKESALRFLEKSYIDEEGVPEKDRPDFSALFIYALIIHEDGETKRGDFTLELTDEDAHEVHGVEFKARVPSTLYMDD